MSSKRPLILVTGPDRGGRPAWLCTAYLVWRMGGRPKWIHPKHPEIPEDFSGIVLGGGADVHPSRYKETLLKELKSEIQRVPKIRKHFIFSALIWWLRRIFSVRQKPSGTDLDRDRLEWKVIEKAVAKKVPILGICRGAQLLNVFFGGTLYQNIESFFKEEPMLHTVRARKWVYLEPESHLAQVLRRNKTKVNSLHKQAVKELGKNITVSAREKNGVIQAIENQSLPFVIGVQWHPEFLPYSRVQRRIFRALLKAARSSARMTVQRSCAEVNYDL
jgi:putative glutamine amidotransferase